ncbi:MAG: hypothetical protein EP311_03200 [Cytophagales bacterium]|uniref:Uncharacterized protein n=1 Tax=Algoriphagus taiwanensis TaxID=1445656 RepID=A0ABQ6Q2F1_9BACT|nr:MAG: hypothetical protein EP311_03200 [Cytophagales bacterium]GMQ34354.1 hypothetical protein Ataiwa_26260 [Algoriphagus taiwanensis]
MNYKSITYSKILILLLGLINGMISSAKAQEAASPAKPGPPSPPIPLELMFGHEQLNFQLIVKKKFSPTSKFDLLVISVFSENWNQENNLGNSVVIPFQFNYNIGKKGFAIAAGGEGNSVVGFSPLVGLEHSYASKKWLAITVLNYLINEEQDLKLFGLYEFKPPINETWSLYSRVQFVYNLGLAENQHNRSFLYLRLGLKKGPLGFGLGANWDQYGSEKVAKDNFGVFTRWEF